MRIEKIFAGIFLIGLLFKFMHWPFSGLIIALSLNAIAIFYFPLAFYFFRDRKTKKQNIVLSIVSGFFVSMVPVGIMFKVMYWPGVEMTLLVGFLASVVVLIVAFILKQKASQELTEYYKNMIKRMAVLVSFSALFYFTPSATLVKIDLMGIQDEELVRVKTNYLLNPGNEQYQKEHDEYMKRLDLLESKD